MLFNFINDLKGNKNEKDFCYYIVGSKHIFE